MCHMVCVCVSWHNCMRRLPGLLAAGCLFMIGDCFVRIIPDDASQCGCRIAELYRLWRLKSGAVEEV